MIGSKRTRVLVERQGGKIIRIFKSHNAAYALMGQDPKVDIVEVPRSVAVTDIRSQIFDRTEGNCEWCGAPMTAKQMHLHERKFRSHGGDISLANSVGICYDCHEGRPDAAHKGLQFGVRRV